MIKKICLLLLISWNVKTVYAQKVLLSWSPQNITNYTKEMYDAAQQLTAAQLLEKNLQDSSWSEIFLTLGASVNNYEKDTNYLRSLAEQITNTTETKLKGTSQLIIWDRIITGDIIFEGKGLVIENDLFTVAGRANQLLQNLCDRNLGYISVKSTPKDLEIMKEQWLAHLNNERTETFRRTEMINAKIPEISSLSAVHALIISLQTSVEKEQITNDCLKTVYKLDKMPGDKNDPAQNCNPDRYTFGYLGILFGDEKTDETKNAEWWLNFWAKHKDKLSWDIDKGIYTVNN